MKKFIENRLGGYRQCVVSPDISKPEHLETAKNVVVIGAGLAGIGAASVLAQRGFSVTLLEKNKYLGGKVGSWPVQFEGGFSTQVEHGFHAFFRQYYNLLNFMEKLNLKKNLIPIDDYLVLSKQFGNLSFKNVATTPLLNILSMRKLGAYRISEMLFKPQSLKLIDLFRFRDATFKKWDSVSFEEFAKKTRLSSKLRMVFNSFSRAFFAEPGMMSTAELIKGFHLYFLSNDAGLLYDVLDDDFSTTLLNPIREHLEQNKVDIRLNAPVSEIRLVSAGFLVNDRRCTYVVLASDVKGTRSIVNRSPQLQAYPGFSASAKKLKASQRYAVLRVWLDKDTSPSMPFFVFTDREKVLDSVTFYHRMEKTSADWVRANGGGIFELHCYAVPDEIKTDREIRDRLLGEFEGYFPDIRPYKIKHEYLQVKNDFTAFHTGLYKDRPTTETDVPNLFLAGDWVKLPYPMMLMEAAYTSGVLAANNILAGEGLRREPVFSVPLHGLLS